MWLKNVELSSRVIALTAMMGALGNTLSAVSIGLTKVGQIGLDLSHVATFIAAIYGGPLMGFLVGLIGGFVPGLYFGPMGGLAWLGFIGLPVGKSLTGLTTGALYRLLNVGQRGHPSLFTIPVVLMGYAPECLFTVFFFLVLVPYFLGWVGVSLLIYILIKAWIEIALMSVFMGALTGNGGFSNFMANFLAIRRVR